MNGQCQIRPDQGEEALKVALEKNIESRPAAEKCSGRGHVLTYAMLKDKCAKLEV